MANLLNFKFGQWASLPTNMSAGTVYVTTDEQAMYIDLPSSHEANAELKRLRIGDIIVKDSVKDAKPPFAEGAFYYFVKDNALVRWSNGSWKQINSVSDVQANIDGLTDTLNNVIIPKFDDYLELEGGTMEGTIDMDGNAIINVKDPVNDGDAVNKKTLTSGLSTKVNTSDFTDFQTTNTQAIADAKKAGTDAQNTINNTIIPKFDDYLELDGGTMQGNIVMGSHKVTSTATPSANEDLTNKAYVDGGLATKVDTDDFADFQTTNNQAIAAAKKAGTDAQNTINNTIIPKFDDYLLLDGGTMQGNINMDSKSIKNLADPIDDGDAVNKKTLTSGLSTKVDTSEFTTFQATNTQNIADAKQAGLTAQNTINNTVLPKFDEYLELDGGTMQGNIAMGNHKITSSAIPSANEDLTNKTYVDSALNGKVDTDDFDDFKVTNEQAIADAKKAGTDAQNSINTVVMPKFDDYLLLDGGKMAGAIDMDGKAITNVKDPVNDGDAVNKKTLTSGLSTKVNTSDFTDFQTSNNNAIADAKKAGTDAQNTINTVVMPKFDEYLSLDGGKMAGPIDMDGNKITSSATPSANNDVTNKAYVDAGLNTKVDNSAFTTFQTNNDKAIADAKKAGTDAQNTISTVVMPKFDEYLSLDGGSVSGDINMGNGATVTGLKAPVNDSDAATKKYVDDALSANDAMTFKGVLGDQNGQILALPATANVGDTYKVGKAGTYGSITAKVGDLIINAAENDSDTPVWLHISSGYEDDYLQKLAVNENTIYLTDGVDPSYVGGVSGLTIVGAADSNLQFAVSAGSGNAPVHTVTASMVWGTF